jgi:small subunit ribosomal protein S4e
MTHIKRLAAPDFWPILKKQYKWTISPSPGPHKKTECIPLGIIIRDIFGYASNLKEVKYILSQGYVKRDKIVVKDYKFPVGLMDTLEFIKDPFAYRLLPYKGYPLVVTKIPLEESSLKICRIENKVAVKGNKLQVNLNDGRNFLIEKTESANFKTYDSVLLELPEQKIKETIKLQEGVLCLITGGVNAGYYGYLKKIIELMPRRKSIVEIESYDGKIIRTSLKYIMPIGYDKPLIKIAEKEEDIVKPAIYYYT